MLKEFREFILRGNVVDLAIAVVIGAAFGAVVTALVGDIITPLDRGDRAASRLRGLVFTITAPSSKYGHFLNARQFSFLTIAAGRSSSSSSSR